MGQVFCGIAQPFLVNVPTKLVVTWFGPKERVIALTLTVVAQALGATFGYAFPIMFVGPDDTDQTFRDNVRFSLLV